MSSAMSRANWNLSNVALRLLMLMLACHPCLAAAEASHYQKGLELFSAGQEREAIAQFVIAAEKSQTCEKIFASPKLENLPSWPCDLKPGKPVKNENLEPLVWFQVANIKWNQESEKLKSLGKPERGHHDRSLFQEFLARWPDSSFAARAALILMEDGFCVTWAGFPDCGMIEVQGYEELLKHYPGSEMREEIELKRAKVYYQMAWLWQNGAGVKSDRWSDLFRSQSLEIVRRLKQSPNQQIKQETDELEQKLNKDFARPLAPLVVRVLTPDYY